MRDRTFLILLVVASLLIKIPIALFFLHGFGIDESLYMATARDYSETGNFGVHTELNDFRFIAPLLAFVMSGFYKIFGGPGTLLVSPIMGSLAIIPFFYLGKIAIGSSGGRLAAILAFFNPAFFLLNTRPLTESIGLLLFTVSIVMFLMALKEKRYWIFVLPSLLLTFLARYPYGLLLAVFFIAVLAVEKKWKSVLNYKILIGLLLALAIATPWLLFNYQSFGNLLGGPLHQGTTDAGFNYETASWYVPYLFLIAGATLPFMIYGLLKRLQERKLDYAMVGFFAIFLVQFFVFGKSVEERYILPILPFAAIFTIYGYDYLLKWKKNLVNYAFIGLIVLNILGAAYLTYIFAYLPKYSDTQEALIWVKDNCGPVIFGNVFTPAYEITRHDVIQPSFDPDKDHQTIVDKNVDCVIVDAYESPYKDFFRNDFNAEKMTFGNVFVYKIH